MHSAKQKQWLSENLLGLVSRIWKIQNRYEIVGKETGGKFIHNMRVHNNLISVWVYKYLDILDMRSFRQLLSKEL